MATKKSRSLKTPEIPPGVIDRHLVEPSWTGPRARNVSGYGDRVRHWLGLEHKQQPDMTAGIAFTENINWRIFRIMAEFVEGFEFLAGLNKAVSVFGSARAGLDNPYYQLAKELGMLCGRAGFTMITGGGPGIMEAANWGAFDGGGTSVGLDISLPKEQRRNQYIHKSMGFRYFFTRKVMLSAAAQAYIFFPGGIGTLNELIEIVELIQTGKMSDQVPVILLVKDFWQPMLDWMTNNMLEDNRFIDAADLGIMRIVNTPEEAFAIIKKTKERRL